MSHFYNLTEEVQHNILYEGFKKIIKLNVFRIPVSDTFNNLSKLFTLGQINKAMKKLGYDKLFHLYLEAQLSDGNKYRIEKGIVIKLEFVVSDDERSFEHGDIKLLEKLPVNIDMKLTPLKKGSTPNLFDNLDLKTLFEKTDYKMGDKFIPYNIAGNNCQDFISQMLDANGLLTKKLKKFILQDSKAIFKELGIFDNSVFIDNVIGSLAKTKS